LFKTQAKVGLHNELEEKREEEEEEG